MIDIQIDPAQMTAVRVMTAHIRNGASRVMVRGINRTLTGVRTDATRLLGRPSGALFLTQTRVRRDFIIRRAGYGFLSASVRSTGSPVGLRAFGARRTTRGVSVIVLRSSGRKLIPHAFIRSVRGTEHVFRRDPDEVPYRSTWRRAFPYGALPREYRYPGGVLPRLSGPRIQDIYARPEVEGAVTEMAGERLENNINHELDYLLSQVG